MPTGFTSAWVRRWPVWAQEAFTGLTQRLPVPALETEELSYHPTVVSRALKALPVVF